MYNLDDKNQKRAANALWLLRGKNGQHSILGVGWVGIFLRERAYKERQITRGAKAPYLSSALCRRRGWICELKKNSAPNERIVCLCVYLLYEWLIVSRDWFPVSHKTRLLLKGWGYGFDCFCFCAHQRKNAICYETQAGTGGREEKFISKYFLCGAHCMDLCWLSFIILNGI